MSDTKQALFVTRGPCAFQLAAALACLVGMTACGPGPEKAPALPGDAGAPSTGPAAELALAGEEGVVAQGEALAKTVCAACHVYPPPETLDRVTWGMKALPKMGEMMGFIDPAQGTNVFSRRVVEAGIFPTAPIIPVEQWRAICSFYLAKSPVTAAPQPPRPEIKIGLERFEVEPVKSRLHGRATLAHIDEPSSRIFIGEFDSNQLSIFDGSGALRAKTVFETPPVALSVDGGKLTATLLGSYDPSDELSAAVVQFNDLGAGDGAPQTLLKDLPRATHSRWLDVNEDGRPDLVVSGFGNYLGSLTWHENRGGGEFVEHVIVDWAGVIRTETTDLNHDGHMDLISVCAQAREGIYAHINDGRGGFTTEPLALAHPAWGFTGIELVDFNADGFVDILATNGDNGDFGAIVPPFKNYHGIRMYLNDGTGGFEEAWFFPLNGAYKAMARDYDGDGDLDIAAISHFPDYRRSARESFVYLENRSGATSGAVDLAPSSFYESIAGRWSVMDSGDVDGDGDIDIVLGANNHGPTLVPGALHRQWIEIGHTVYILRNKTR